MLDVRFLIQTYTGWPVKNLFIALYIFLLNIEYIRNTLFHFQVIIPFLFLSISRQFDNFSTARSKNVLQRCLMIFNELLSKYWISKIDGYESREELDLQFKLIENGNLNGERSKEDNQQGRWLTSNWRIRILNDEVKESAANPRFSPSTESCSSFKRSRLINTKPGYLSLFPRHGIRISNFHPPQPRL